MPPLAISLCLEFYLIGRISMDGVAASVLASIVLGIYVLLWFILPRTSVLQRMLAGKR